MDPVDLVEADGDIEAFPDGVDGAVNDAMPNDPPVAEMDEDGVDLTFSLTEMMRTKCTTA